MNISIIPAIDLLDGQVVHARGGDRARYLPLQSTLCRSAEPIEVISALMRLHTFRIVYVADLGAILARGDHDRELLQLHRRFPGVCFWVDSGHRRSGASGPGCRTVIGTETGVDATALRALAAAGADYVLSLDFSARGFLGDPAVLQSPGCWPRDIIIMHLPSVGTSAGPAWPIIDEILARAPDRAFHIAGGVCNASDLELAAARGIRGALVATALHTGTLIQLQATSNKQQELK
ncbi:MAG: hypothetical protein HYR49_02000 [Gammaproteobacteria bacterium]|nr:hypothetical protein [Gammaproteobacteria bacterium]